MMTASLGLNLHMPSLVLYKVTIDRLARTLALSLSLSLYLSLFLSLSTYQFAGSRRLPQSTGSLYFFLCVHPSLLTCEKKKNGFNNISSHIICIPFSVFLLKKYTLPQFVKKRNLCNSDRNGRILIKKRSNSAKSGRVGSYVLLIIIMLAYLYCAAYTRMTMNESSPPSEQKRITLNDDGQRVQLAQPELPTPHYICMYWLLPTTPPPPSPSRHYNPRLIAGTNLPTPKGWIAWLAKADCTHITFAQRYYTIESKDTRRK